MCVFCLVLLQNFFSKKIREFQQIGECVLWLSSVLSMMGSGGERIMLVYKVHCVIIHSNPRKKIKSSTYHYKFSNLEETSYCDVQKCLIQDITTTNTCIFIGQQIYLLGYLYDTNACYPIDKNI